MIKPLSKVFSYLFHPLFMLTYMLVLLMVVNPYAFGMRSIKDGDQVVLIIFLSSVLIPLVSVVMSYFLGWIKSFEMMTREERIAPLLVTIVMYVSMYYYITKSNVFPWFFQVCALGVLIGLFLAFFLNNFSKISLHAVGMGGLVSMVILMVMYFAYHQVELTLPWIGAVYLTKYTILYASILVAGVVCSARLLLGAHRIQDIYGGFIVGFFSQLIAFIILQ
jgi:membrane-associated phospholipid phosphatase